MSQENVELVLQAMEEANAGIFGLRFDALFDPALDFRDELGTLDNRDDLRRYIDSYRESFGGFRVELEEVRDLGSLLVLRILQGGRGSSSGIDIEQHFTWLMTFDQNRCIRWQIYADHGEALEAAGLSE
jgi:SnoaL-like domain